MLGSRGREVFPPFAGSTVDTWNSGAAQWEGTSTTALRTSQDGSSVEPGAAGVRVSCRGQHTPKCLGGNSPRQSWVHDFKGNPWRGREVEDLC